MPLTMNSLADLDHPENLNLELQTGEPFVNLHIASVDFTSDRNGQLGSDFNAGKRSQSEN